MSHKHVELLTVLPLWRLRACQTYGDIETERAHTFGNPFPARRAATCASMLAMPSTVHMRAAAATRVRDMMQAMQAHRVSVKSRTLEYGSSMERNVIVV